MMRALLLGTISFVCRLAYLKTGFYKKHSTCNDQCATEPCKVLAIQAEPLRAMLKKNSLVGLQVMSVVAQAYFSRYVETLKRVQKVVNEIAVI